MKRILPFVTFATLASLAQAADKPPAPSGQAVYEHWCAPVLLERTDLAPQAIATFVRQGVLLMAPFRKTEISDAELAALTAYVAKNFKSQ